MLRIMAVLFGVALIFIGVAGFFPQFKVDNLLFGYFMIDKVLNLVHIVSGVIAIMAATSFFWSRVYFQLLGIIYALLAIIGFWRDGDLSIMHVNMSDNLLHICIAVVALYLGFVIKSPRPSYY